MHVKRRRTLMLKTKGMKWGRKSKMRLARAASLKAGAHARADRRAKKRVFRNLWTIKINAAVRSLDMSYSKFIHALKEKNIALDRKSLAYLAEHKPAVFAKVVDATK